MTERSPRRRRWTLVAACVLLAAGAAGVSTLVPVAPTPWHFWIRTDEDPHRLFDAPEGRELRGWTATAPSRPVALPEPGVEVIEETGLVRRLLAMAGADTPPPLTLIAQVGESPNASAKWFECFACEAVWPEEAAVDAALVGEWDLEGAAKPSALRLLPDGQATIPRGREARWGRVGDVVLFGPLGAGSSSIDAAVLAPDGRSLRNAAGRTYVRRR